MEYNVVTLKICEMCGASWYRSEHSRVKTCHHCSAQEARIARGEQEQAVLRMTVQMQRNARVSSISRSSTTCQVCGKEAKHKRYVSGLAEAHIHYECWRNTASAGDLSNYDLFVKTKGLTELVD